MSRLCPVSNEIVIYPVCMECEHQICKSQPHTEKFSLLVAGSRTFHDYKMLKNVLDTVLAGRKSDIIEIVEGGARGADELAGRYAKENDYLLKIFPAEWETFGKAAGYIRNKKMHEYLATNPNRGCICFWDGKSKGTQHNFDLADQYKTPLKIINYEGN